MNIERQSGNNEYRAFWLNSVVSTDSGCDCNAATWLARVGCRIHVAYRYGVATL